MHVWWQDRSLIQKILVGVGFGILGVGFMALFGWVTMLLWNGLMPAIFGLGRLGYWQAWGVLVLSWILFRGMRMGSDNGRRSDRRRRRHRRRYMEEGEPPEGDEPSGTAQA